MGGPRLSTEVIQAMGQAAMASLPIADLELAAGDLIALATHAESGYVTSGASAGLTLAAAACMAGMRPDVMDALPEPPTRCEMVVQKAHRNPYDHALRAAGAKLIEVGYPNEVRPYEIENALSPRAAAVFFLAVDTHPVQPLPVVIDIAHRHSVPVIVDAAGALPPASNLYRFIDEGADLVVFSGGKHLEGPQASGIVCGRRDLIESIARQHQDMDGRFEWSTEDSPDTGVAPYQGLGRGFKASKEAIAGLMAALARYRERDFERELGRWEEVASLLVDDLASVRSMTVSRLFPQPNGQPVPTVTVEVKSNEIGVTAHSIVTALERGDPPIYVVDAFVHLGRFTLSPECLTAEEARLVGDRIKEATGGDRQTDTTVST